MVGVIYRGLWFSCLRHSELLPSYTPFDWTLLAFCFPWRLSFLKEVFYWMISIGFVLVKWLFVSCWMCLLIPLSTMEEYERLLDISTAHPIKIKLLLRCSFWLLYDIKMLCFTSVSFFFFGQRGYVECNLHFAAARLERLEFGHCIWKNSTKIIGTTPRSSRRDTYVLSLSFWFIIIFGIICN